MYVLFVSVIKRGIGEMYVYINVDLFRIFKES